MLALRKPTRRNLNMQNSAQKINTATQKNVSLSSINVKNTLEHIKFLQNTEKLLLVKIMEKARLYRGEHDLNTWLDYSNGQFGYLLDRSGESVRLAKEGLQARGIITVDGMTWDQHKKENGSRKRTAYSQRIQLTPDFVGWFKSCVSNRKIITDRQWGYAEGYVIKKELSRFKSAMAMLRFKANQVSKLLITMGESCESVANKLVPSATNFLGTFTKTEDSKFNTEDNNRIGYWLPSQEKESIESKLRNPLLANLSSYTNKKVKIWTDATTRICKQLIDSGMTKIEVARAMIHQNYVNSINEFEAKYSPPIVS
jgi:hypothetical protein